MAALGATPASPRAQRPFEPYGPWQTAMVVGWGCDEAIALLGLILAFLRHDAGLFVPFGAVSVLLLLQAKPRLDDLLTLARRSV